MESSPSLLVLLLGELILLLLIILFFVVLYLRKQKILLKKLLEKSNQVKELYEEKAREYEGFYANHKKDSNNPSLPEYLAQGIHDAQQRYEKYTQAKIPKIDIGQSFGAKVAALRFFYLTAEQEVFQERGVTHAGWNLFEKKLADIVRWFTKQTTARQDVRSNRTRLLQERIDALKPFEAEAKKLQRSLDLSKKRQEQLETTQKESKATIFSLQKMLRSMKQPSPEGVELGKEISINNMSTEEYLAHSSHKMESISTVSDQQGNTLKNIIFELNNHHADMSPDVRKKIESSIKMMEIEMMKSDQYITNLKKELKEAKLQATNYALMLRDNKSALKSDLDGREEAKLHLTASSSDFSLTELSSISPTDYLDRDKIMQEIRHLRGNNTAQRGLIVQLEHELSLVKDSLIETEDETVRLEKQKEVNRLTRLVKECEGCIEILESEVDNLYLQLQERGALNANSGTSSSFDVNANANSNEPDSSQSSGDQDDVIKLSFELEEMAKEMEKIAFQYRQTHSVNQFIYDIIQCATVDEVAKHIVQFIKEFNALAGFCINSTAGSAEYFPPHIFNENMKELVKSFSFKDPVFYLGEGTLFSSKKLCLMLLSDPTQTKSLSEMTLQGLVRVVDDHVQHLESESMLAQRSKGMASWIESTKNHLSDLDIQYAFQVEENKKTFNNFLAEIRQAYHLLDLKGSGAVLLDNAINEYEQRMYLLLSSGDVIDREISNLITHIDQLKS